MCNRLKMWAYVATLLGGAFLASGCGSLFGSQNGLILAILQEDLFG
jgi:predicted ABC-type sugar transport system permease subunit